MTDLRYGPSKKRQPDISKESYQRRLAIESGNMKLSKLKKQPVAYVELVDDPDGNVTKRMYVNGNDGYYYCYSPVGGIKRLSLPISGMSLILYKLDEANLDDNGVIQFKNGKVFKVISYIPNQSYTIHKLELAFTYDFKQ